MLHLSTKFWILRSNPTFVRLEHILGIPISIRSPEPENACKLSKTENISHVALVFIGVNTRNLRVTKTKFSSLNEFSQNKWLSSSTFVRARHALTICCQLKWRLLVLRSPMHFVIINDRTLTLKIVSNHYSLLSLVNTWPWPAFDASISLNNREVQSNPLSGSICLHWFKSVQMRNGVFTQ